MTYEYHCESCGRDEDIRKPLSLIGRAETCPDCNSLMDRVIVAPYVNWQHNLTVKERDENTRYRLETGNNRICVGTEKPNLTPKLREYPDAEYALARHNNG